MRLHERFLDIVRSEFRNQIPDLVNYELKHEDLPKEFNNDNFAMKNIVYGPMLLDLDTFDIEFLTYTKGFLF